MSFHRTTAGLVYALLVSVAPLQLSPAQAQEANRCDELAGHPEDPNRMSRGVAFDEIIPLPAVSACEEAVRVNPSEPRNHYQLGRAYDAAGRTQEAITHFRQAEAASYAAASYSLGYIAERQGNIEEAIRLYRVAADGRISSASERISLLQFDPSRFSSPQLFEAIYSGSIQGAGDQLITYMTVFIELFYNTRTCGGVVVDAPTYTRISQLAQGAVFRGVLGAMADTSKGGYEAGQGVTMGIAVSAGAAEKDAQTFFSAYGCEGLVAKTFFQNLRGWVQSL